MKLTITTLLLLISTISFAQIPSYVPSNGLVGWWPFNGNANDESGNGNNGTVNGASLTADRFGVADKAYSFDGLNDYIEVLNCTPQFNNSSQTLSLWMKFNTQYNFSSLALIKNGTSYLNGFNFFIDQNNSVYGNDNYLVGILLGNGNTVNFISNQTELGQWANLVATYDGANIKIYFNGILKGIASYSGSLNCPNNNLVFGQWDNLTPPNSYNRNLDDIGIWNRALTECEIKDLYYAQLGYSTVDAGADQTICRGDLVTLQGAGGSSLAWDNGVIDGVPFEPAQSGAYVLTGADSLGCIGIDTVQVIVLENASSTINQTAIDSYTLNGQTYTQSGTYTQVVPAANGCDSVITLNLELDFTGIQSHTNTSLQLYPNPVKDVMTLVGLKGEAVSYAVYSVDGKLIKSGQTSGEIQLEDLIKGNYILKIENEALPFVKL